MNHSISDEEAKVMSEMDFIVPLKQVGIITRAVVESIYSFYHPRRIIVITSKKEVNILKSLALHWDLGRFECIEEENFFQPHFELTLEDIVSEYDPDREGDQREPGWWVQQLIKLGAATQIPNISSIYVVWDGDLVPIRRWKLCDVDKKNGQIRYHIAILQGESRSEFNTSQYARCMKESVGFTPLEPEQGGTFVTHHMVFQKKYVEELLKLMIKTTGSTIPWPKLIMSLSQRFYRFSEYKTYCTFMVRYHKNDFYHHPFNEFGEGGLRFREANCVIDEMLTNCKVSFGGIPYQQVREFVLSNWKSLSTPGQVLPAYIQLDHVYGLQGIDISDGNITVDGTVDSSPICIDTTFENVRVSDSEKGKNDRKDKKRLEVMSDRRNEGRALKRSRLFLNLN